MGNLPVLKPAEVIALLLKLGFVEVRQRGSHKQFRNSAGRGTTVPFHKGRDIAPSLLRQIAKDRGRPFTNRVTGSTFRNLAIELAAVTGHHC